MAYISFDFEEKILELDPTDPRVARALLQAYLAPVAGLAEAVTGESPSRQVDRIAAVFATALTRLPTYTPEENPSFQAWLYRHVWHVLIGRLPSRQRKAVSADMPMVLAAPPHALNVAEIAHVLNQRENRIATQVETLTSPDPSDPSGPAEINPIDIDLEVVLDKVHLSDKPLPSDPTSRRKLFPQWQEFSWLVLAGLAVLAVIQFSNRNLATGGEQALFPTRTPQLPPIQQIADLRTVEAPEAERSAFTEYIYNSEPVLSDNGRFVAFASNDPSLVRGDTNLASDIFVFDKDQGTIERVSVSSEGAQSNSDSYTPDISADGRFVVFVSNATNLGGESPPPCQQRAYWGSCSYIFRHDRMTGETVQVTSWRDGSTFEHPSVLPTISGDGNVVAFWAFRGIGSVDSCEEVAGDEIVCADLTVRDFKQDITRRIAVGKSFYDMATYLSMSGDGRLIALQLGFRDRFYQRLQNPNEFEAVLYDWQRDEIKLLNVDENGNPGNGNSYIPVISTDGNKAIFISDSSNLVPGDENDANDVFVFDLETGQIEAASQGSDGILGNGSSGTIGPPNWNSRIHISANGRYVVYISAAENLVENPSAVWCGDIFFQFWDCYGLYVRDLEQGTNSQIAIQTPWNTTGVTLISYPSISRDGRHLSFMSYEIDSSGCVPNNCSDIWILDRFTSEIFSASHEKAEEADQGKWHFQATLPGHNGWVNSVVFTPEGLLVSGGQDGSVLVQDASGREVQRLQEQDQPINSVAVSPDGKFLAAGSVDGSVAIWDLSRTEVIHLLESQSGQILDLTFSPDGEALAVGSQKALWIWELDGGQFFRTHNISQQNVRALAYSPDGRILATVSKTEIWLRDTGDGGVIRRVGGHTLNVLDVAFSPDGSLLASASADGDLHLWRISGDESDLTVEYDLTLHHGDWVHALAFSPTEPILASGTFDSTIHLWALKGGMHMETLHRSNQDQVLSLSFSEDGHYLAGGTVRGVRLWSRGKQAAVLDDRSDFFNRLASNIMIEPVNQLPTGLRSFSLPLDFPTTLQETAEQAPFAYAELKDVDDRLTLSSTAFFRKETNGFDGVIQVYLYSTSFQPAVLVLSQSEANPKFFDLPIAQRARVRKFPLVREDLVGELVLGGWSYSGPIPVNGQFSSVERFWNENAASFWLRWYKDGWYFSLFYDQPFDIESVSDPEKLSLDEFLNLASTLIEP